MLRILLAPLNFHECTKIRGLHIHKYLVVHFKNKSVITIQRAIPLFASENHYVNLFIIRKRQQLTTKVAVLQCKTYNLNL